MLPTVFDDASISDVVPGFDDIFREFEVIADADDADAAEQSLELIACLLFGSTMMLDHVETHPRSGEWRYSPPEPILRIIERTVPRMPVSNVPLAVYLHLLDAIAWNEDVKYSRKAETKAKLPRETGRPNMLATCVTFIAVTIGRESAAEAFAQMAKRRGVCTLSQNAACELFPPLEPESLRPL